MTKEEEKYTTLDTEQCKWWVNTLFSIAKEKACNSHNFDDAEEMQSAQDKIIKALEQQPCDDCVSRQAVVEYIKASNAELGHVCENEDVREDILNMPPVTPTQSWIPLVWDEYPTVDSDGNDDYVYAVDYSVPMPKEDEWVLITDENHNVVKVQYDGYDFGDYARENILAWQPLPQPYEEKRGDLDGSN